MKKTINLVLALVIIFSSVPAFATGSGDFNVTVNGVEYKPTNGEPSPYINDDKRTMVPVRFVSSQLGISDDNVSWDSSTQTATIIQGNTNIAITVGQSIIKVTEDGVTQRIIMDTQAEVTNGRTFIPARYIAEALGARIEWNSSTQTVLILTDDKVVDGPDQPNIPDQEEYEKDPYGRIIRTTNLPKNHEDFPYILAALPNEMYEMKYSTAIDGFITSAENYHDKEEFSKENVSQWMDNIRNHYDLVLNVDYRTVDQTWADELFNSYAPGGNERVFKRDIQQYIQWVKDNEIIVEGWLDPEPSMIYDTIPGRWVRSQYEFNVVSYKENKNLLFDSGSDVLFLEKGKVYKGFVDVDIYKGKVKKNMGLSKNNSTKLYKN